MRISTIVGSDRGFRVVSHYRGFQGPALNQRSGLIAFHLAGYVLSRRYVCTAVTKPEETFTRIHNVAVQSTHDGPQTRERRLQILRHSLTLVGLLDVSTLQIYGKGVDPERLGTCAESGDLAVRTVEVLECDGRALVAVGGYQPDGNTRVFQLFEVRYGKEDDLRGEWQES